MCVCEGVCLNPSQEEGICSCQSRRFREQKHICETEEPETSHVLRVGRGRGFIISARMHLGRWIGNCDNYTP